MTTSPDTAAAERAAALQEFGIEPAPLAVASSTPAPGRDSKGRFLPGCAGGPGRPRGEGVDIRRAAQDVAAERGIDLPRAIGEVMLRLIELAKSGDVGAAKLVLDKLGIADPDQQSGVVVQVVTGVPRPDSAAVGVRVITRNGDQHHAPDND